MRIEDQTAAFDADVADDATTNPAAAEQEVSAEEAWQETLNTVVTIAWSKASGKQNDDWGNTTGPLGAFISAQIGTFPESAKKDNGAYLQGELALNESGKAYRGASNMVSASILVLDYDDGTTAETIEAGMRRLGVGGFIANTYSSDPKKVLKYRAGCPLKEPFDFGHGTPDNAERIALWPIVRRLVVADIGGRADKATDDPARLFYRSQRPIGSDPANFTMTEIVGHPLDLAPYIEKAKVELAASARPKAKVKSGPRSTTTETPDLAPAYHKYGSHMKLGDFVLEQAGGLAKKNKKGWVNYVCPLSEEHTGAVKDGGMAVNYDVTRWGHCGCRHDHKGRGGLSALAALDEFMKEYGLTVLDVLSKDGGAVDWEAYYADNPLEKLADEAEEALEDALDETADIADVTARIADLDHMDSAGRAAIMADVAKLSPGDADLAITALFDRTRISKKPLKDELKAACAAREARLDELRADAAEKRSKANRAQADKARAASGEAPTPTLEDALEAYNTRFAFVLHGQDGRIVELPDEPGAPVRMFRVQTFREWRAPDKGLVSSGDDEEPRETMVAPTWLYWKKRRTFDRVVFDPSKAAGQLEKEERTLNLWRGFGVEARGGDWSEMRRHLFVNVCRSNPFWFAQTMSWLADIVQFPSDKKGTAIVVQGKKGTGKSKVAFWVMALMPNNSMSVEKKDQWLGRFNGHAAGKLLTVAEEAFWAGDKEAEGAMKSKITEVSQLMEKKGVDAISVANHERFWLNSNNEWVVPATRDERRFFVLHALDTWAAPEVPDAEFAARKKAYFEGIDGQMKDGGLEAMMFDLMALCIPKFVDLRNAPHTPFLRGQIESTFGPIEAWFYDVLQNGEIDGCDLTEPQSVDKDIVRDSLAAYCKTHRGRMASDVAVGRFLGKLGGRAGKGKALRPGGHRPPVYILPSLADMRAAFSKEFGGTFEGEGEAGDAVALDVDYSTFDNDRMTATELAAWRAYGLGETDELPG